MADHHDSILDARAELAGDGVYLSTREAVLMSLNATHGNSDLVPVLRDASSRHPFGLPSTTVPTDGHHRAGSPPRRPMTPDAAASPLSSLGAAAADGSSPDLSSAA